jgi:hypothetical protein
MAEEPMDPSTRAAANLSNVSEPRRAPQTCRWGDSTLYMAFPEWLSAWDAPWTCRHPAHTGPLETVDTCITCPDWRSGERPNDRRRT